MSVLRSADSWMRSQARSAPALRAKPKSGPATGSQKYAANAAYPAPAVPAAAFAEGAGEIILHAAGRDADEDDAPAQRLGADLSLQQLRERVRGEGTLSSRIVEQDLVAARIGAHVRPVVRFERAQRGPADAHDRFVVHGTYPFDRPIGERRPPPQAEPGAARGG